MHKTATCKICYLQDHTDNRDLDSNVHEGFTIGKGKAMYWMISWHNSGHCTVFRKDNIGGDLVRRWISGDTLITIHWK